MSLNERGAFIHLLGDAAGSGAVILSTVIIAVWNIRVADPIAAAFVGVLVVLSSVNVLRESTAIIFQKSPVPVSELKDKIMEIERVESVNDIHSWCICSKLKVATVKVEDNSGNLEEREQVRERVHDVFGEYGINHVTVEQVDVQEDTNVE